jgi:hypothetical protein
MHHCFLNHGLSSFFLAPLAQFHVIWLQLLEAQPVYRQASEGSSVPDLEVVLSKQLLLIVPLAYR